MTNTDNQDCQKFTIPHRGEKFYLSIGDSFMQFNGPNESSFENATVYSLMNALCRVASKARNRGMTWGEIAYQINASGVDHRTITEQIAIRIQRYIELTVPVEPPVHDWDDPSCVVCDEVQ